MILAAADFFRSPRTTAALTTAGIGLVAIAFTVQQLIGWPGYLAAVVLLDLLLVASLVARRAEVAWHWAILPISLLAYLAWLVISPIWSSYTFVSAGSVAYLLLVTAIGVFVALSRDTLQIIRSVGDVLRFVLIVSIVLEVFSGILIDAPIAVFDIRGLLAAGGPISGIESTRNQLGLLAGIGAATFAIEWRMRSISPRVAIASLALAVGTIVLTRSPAVTMLAVVLVAAGAVLYGIRRLPPSRRQVAQYAVLGVLALSAALAWIFRASIIGLFNATGELEFRLESWRATLTVIPLHWLEGWGWVGIWNPAIPPYSVLTPTAGRPHASALNAIVDLWLQLGVIGISLFLAMLGLAFVRSWLLAGRRASVVYTWPALVLVALITASFAESSVLVEFGWLLLVICGVKASAELSWRSALSPSPPSSPLGTPR